MGVVVLIAMLAIHYVYTEIKYAYLARKWGTKEPFNTNNYFLGLDIFWKVRKLRQDGNLSDFQKEHYDHLGVDTFMARVVLKRLLHTMNPENIKAVVSTQFDDFGIGSRKPLFRPLLGGGVFASDGEQWKHTRAMLKPQFSREQVGHVHLLEPHIKTFVKHVNKFHGQPFDIQHYFDKLTFDAATEFLFGESVYSLEDESIGSDPSSFIKGKAEFDEAFSFVQNYLAIRASMLNWYWVANSKKFRDSVLKVHNLAQYFVDKALNLRPEEIEKKSKEGYTILYELLKTTRDPTVLRDQLLNVMLAGRSTTASLLSSTFYELSKNPTIWEKLRSEVFENFGTGEYQEDINKITYETLKRCTYLKWVINETLRMYPPVANNFRHADRDTTLPRGGGPDGQSKVLVRKGTIVIFQVYSTHRLERYYGKDAHIFRPERWEDLSKIGWAYMPFSSGPRICLGQQFALTEASYITVRLVQMFANIEDHNKGYPPKKSANATMQHLDGVNIALY